MKHKHKKPFAAPAVVAPRKLRRRPPTERLIRWLLVALTSGGLIARLLWLGRRTMHNDEALQLNGIQTTTWQALIEHCTHVDMHPPLSYLVQKLFWAIDPTTACLRLPSVFLGAAAIPLTYWSLRPLTGRLTALAAASCTAVAYHLIWDSREIRDYIFFYFFAVAAFGCLVRVMRVTSLRQAWPWLLGFALTNVLSVYSHFNTYLIWPIFGLLVVADELTTQGWRGLLRSQKLVWLAGVGLVVLVLAFPTLRWFMSMYHVQQGACIRPGPLALLDKLAGFGLGNGWQAGFWLIWMAVGGVMLRKRARATMWIAIWTFAPLVCYIYLLGMPGKFVGGLVRYQITLALGFVALQGAAVAGVTRRCLPWRAVRPACLLAAILPIVLTVGLMASDFNLFYRLRATSFLYDDLSEALAARGKANVLLDNYYEIQYLRHYLPPDLRLAAPPVFNSAKEYAELKVADYTRRTIEAFPALGYYDTTGARRHADPHTDWSWLEGHFAHCQVFMNTNGIALEHRGLNFFTLPDDGLYPKLYWNNRDELPAWFARHGQPIAATIGPEWFVVPCRTGGAVQIPLPVLAAPGGSLLICNAGTTSVSVKVTLQLVACAPNQVIRFHVAGSVLGQFGPFGTPATVRDLRNGQVQQGFLPFGTLCAQTGGLLQLPVECAFQPQTFSLNLPGCAPGVTAVELVPSQPAGIVLLGLRTDRYGVPEGDGRALTR